MKGNVLWECGSVGLYLIDMDHRKRFEFRKGNNKITLWFAFEDELKELVQVMEKTIDEEYVGCPTRGISCMQCKNKYPSVYKKCREYIENALR